MIAIAAIHHAPTFYFKFPFIWPFSQCNPKEIVFTSFKIGSLFSPKDPIPRDFRTRVVYKFSCAGCNSCYVGETTRHLVTRTREHLLGDKASHVYKHLKENKACRAVCNKDAFEVLDNAPTDYQLKIKEAIHIKWENPSLNSQVKHLNLKLSI